MTRRVPNEWFSLCTTKSPVVSNCPAFRAFIRRSAPPVALFSFFNLFRFTCSHPCLFVLLSLIFCHSLVTDQRSLAHPSGPNNLYRILFLFLFFTPRTFVFASSSCLQFSLPFFLLVYFSSLDRERNALSIRGYFLIHPRAYLIQCVVARHPANFRKFVPFFP